MFKRLENKPEKLVTVSIEGQSIKVPAGETVAAAVLVSGIGYTRTTPVSGTPRAPFCLMGVCYECLMVINDQPNKRACRERVEEGMTIERQQGPGKLST
jgi:predicted molibdopterin-dependent oxidoreductase YjgC